VDGRDEPGHDEGKSATRKNATRKKKGGEWRELGEEKGRKKG
jgi:hypothetical protein